MSDGLFRKKSITELIKNTEKGTTLNKVLTGFDLAMFGLGAIIGTGIFVLTGLGALTAGPAVVLSFVLAGLACAFAALSYAEFASTVPVSGSVYTYSYAALGEFFAWIIGWDLILEYLLAVSAVSAGWSGYLQSLLDGFGVHLPVILSAAPGAIKNQTTIINLPAFFIVILLTFLLSMGVKESKTVNNVLVIVKIAVVLLVIIIGLFYIKPANWTPFMPYGWSGISAGAALLFFAFIGFDAIASAAEETRHPSRDLPIGILGSLGIVTILYVAVSLVVTGMMHFSLFKGHEADPLAFVFQKVGLNWVSGIISIGGILGMTTVMLVMLYGQTRIVFAMSRDGLMPKVFSRVHEKHRTPFISTWIVGVLAALIGGFIPLGELAELVNMGTLTAFTLISISVVVLRHTRPELERKFRCPGVPIVPALSVIFSIYLMIQLPGITWIRFLVWLVIGFIVYFSYSRKHSLLEKA